MSGWKLFAFRFGFRSIERAYQAACKAPDEEIASINAAWDEHLVQVAAGKAVTSEVNEETGDYYDFGEQTGELLFEEEETLRLLREAFAIALYHFWEKHAMEAFQVSWYKQPLVFAKAKSYPDYVLDEDGLDTLRRIANCIKHGNRELFDKHPQMFKTDFQPPPEEKVGWHNALVLTDADLKQAFDAVRRSGPKAQNPAQPKR